MVRRMRMRVLLAGVASLAAGFGYAQVTGAPAAIEPGTTLTFGLASQLTSDSNLDLARPSPGRSTLLDTTLSFGLHSLTRTSRFDLTASGVLRLAHLPGGDDARFDGQKLELRYSHATSGAKISAAARYSADSLQFLDPLSGESLSSSDLAPASGTRRLYGAQLGLETGLDQPLGFVLSAQTSARRYSGAPASYYGSTNTQLSLGAKAHLGAMTTATVSVMGSRYSASDALATRSSTAGLGFALGHDLTEALHLDASLGWTRAQTTAGGVPIRRTAPAFGLGVTQVDGRRTDTGTLQGTVTPTGTRSTLTGGQAFELAAARVSYTLGLTRSAAGTTEGVGSLNYLQDLPTGQLTATVTRQVDSPFDFTGLDTQEELVTRAGVSYRHDLNALSGLRLRMDYARVDPVGGNGVVPRRGESLSAAYERELTPDWTLEAGYRYRHRSDPVTGAAGGNALFFSIGRSLTVRP